MKGLSPVALIALFILLPTFGCSGRNVITQREPESLVRRPQPQSIIIGVGTTVEVTIDRQLSSKTDDSEDKFDTRISSPFIVDNLVVIHV
jgi:hypothetical protein